MQYFEPRPSGAQRFAKAVGGGLSAGLGSYLDRLNAEEQERVENEAIQRQTGENLKGIKSKELRKQILEARHDMNKFQKQKDEAAEKSKQELLAGLAVTRDIEKQYDLPEGSLDAYVKHPALAQKIHAPEKLSAQDKPLTPEQKQAIKQVTSDPNFNELDEQQQLLKLAEGGVPFSKAGTIANLGSKKLDREAGTVDKAYQTQKDFIDKVTSSYRSYETETKPRLLQMQHVNTNEELINASAAKFLDAMNIPLGVLDNPSNELYDKVSKDLLKGLPETYGGGKILQTEVENFLKTIPSLMNSAEGRRMVTSNFLKLGEMREVFYNEMRNLEKKYEEEGKPLPRDFERQILDNVKPMSDRITNEFVKMSEIKHVPPGTVAFFDPSGNIKFVPEESIEYFQNKGGRRIW